MRIVLFSLLACFALSGCMSRDSVNESGATLKRIFALEPKKPFQPHPVASAYCYRTQSDILCYREPQKGMEIQFVAEQPTQSVGEAIVQTAAVAPSVDAIHDDAHANRYPPAAQAFGTAQEAALSYPARNYDSQASFANRTEIKRDNGTTATVYRGSGVTSTNSRGPRVLMPNP